ncbi:MAG: exodeoxyribonuclease VII small subunit [Paludibacteraceae bacterium]|nr:exodeoxyribonuclease VII small subunit [Paludibacteraceae bacterium]
MKEKNFNYAKAMEQVKSIIKEIEENDMDVDAMVAKIEEAAALLKGCRSKLVKTDETVQKILDDIEK